MCPIQNFKIKNYRPDWMTNELIEFSKDRDYYYCKAKKEGDEDSWNIAKYLRNVVNAGIRQAKREFIFNQLKENSCNYKKFWKTIRDVVPSGKDNSKHDILLRDGNSNLKREEVAEFINDYFINIGNPSSKTQATLTSYDDNQSVDIEAGTQLDPVFSAEVLKLVRSINVSKSSGLSNISSYIIKEVFSILILQVTYMFNISSPLLCSQTNGRRL